MMVAYSFKSQFVPAIVSGRKLHTIRGARKRHARAGEQLQLYFGMRTKHCRKIGVAVCAFVADVDLDFVTPWVRICIDGGGIQNISHGGLHLFAQSDGFEDWHDLERWWRLTHGETQKFRGRLIAWRDFERAADIDA